MAEWQENRLTELVGLADALGYTLTPLVTRVVVKTTDRVVDETVWLKFLLPDDRPGIFDFRSGTDIDEDGVPATGISATPGVTQWSSHKVWWVYTFFISDPDVALEFKMVFA